MQAADAVPKPLGPSNTASARPMTTRTTSKRTAPVISKVASTKAAGSSAAAPTVADDDDAGLAAGAQILPQLGSMKAA